MDVSDIKFGKEMSNIQNPIANSVMADTKGSESTDPGDVFSLIMSIILILILIGYGIRQVIRCLGERRESIARAINAYKNVRVGNEHDLNISGEQSAVCEVCSDTISPREASTTTRDSSPCNLPCRYDPLIHGASTVRVEMRCERVLETSDL